MGYVEHTAQNNQSKIDIRQYRQHLYGSYFMIKNDMQTEEDKSSAQVENY